MPRPDERHQEGRLARLRAEVFHALQNVPVNYSCVYRRTEQANQFKRGWNSVTAIDIDVAVNKVTSQNIELNALSFGNNQSIY
jgi:hypothetical protein